MISFLHSTWFLVAINIVLIPLTNSYIHPDEHYQSLEPLLKYIYNGFDKSLNNGSITWEYSTIDNLPIRSITILRLYYEIIVRKLLSLEPYSILVALKYYNFAIFMVTVFIFLRGFSKNKFNNKVSKLMMLTSYTLLTYQVRSFSNSIETVLVMVFLKFLNSDSFFLLGLVFSVGVYNRITFVLWLILPCIYKAYAISSKESFKKIVLYTASLAVSLTMSMLVITKSDSSIYFNSKKIVLAPFENWKYNTDSSNLEKHGIHSRFNHLLINTPVLLSPFVLILIVLNFKSKIFIKNKLPMLSCISGLFFLSIFPHQEARFLIPVIPLFYSAIDYEGLREIYFKSSTDLKKRVFQLCILGHIIFNVIMALIMGSWHQSGLVSISKNLSFLDTINDKDVIFWHTLMPLHWPFYLRATDKSKLFINFVDDEANDYGFRQLNMFHDFITSNDIFDFMGVNIDNFDYLIKDIKQRKQQESITMNLVVPTRFRSDLQHLGYTYEVVDHFPYHLNLNDGFDKSPLGLDILEIII